jgi:MscS family membrane protein
MEWLNAIYWNNPVRDYLVAGGMAVGAFFLGMIIAGLLRRWVIRGSAQTKGKFDDVIAGVGHRLVMVLVFLAGLHAAFRVLALPDWMDQTLWGLFVMAWTVLGTLSISRLLNGFLVHFVKRHAEEGESLLDAQLVPIIRTVVSVGVWLVAGLFALSNLGFNIGSILAGLGIGGLALAMASKDLLSNIFGAFTILVQGPFRVGDAIKYQGQTGTVESLGLRATRIRTYDGHLVTVPNALATTSVVENISRRPSFRVLFQLGLEYGTSREQNDRAVTLITEAIEGVEGTKKGPLIHFIEFGESALVYQVLYHIEAQGSILDIRHAVNGRILQALETANINLAFPTITLLQPQAQS